MHAGAGSIMIYQAKSVARLITPCLILLTPACRPESEVANVSQLLSNSSTTAPEFFCVSKHVREFINLNSERSQRYAILSHGRSLSISNKLIAFERGALATLPLIENQALTYQRRGVPLLCLDVIATHETLDIVESQTLPSKPFQPFDGGALSKDLFRYRFSGKEEMLESSLEEALHKLNENSHYNCLLRHFVESTLRTVRLVPKYRLASRKRGLTDPSGILSTYINSQILFFFSAAALDKEAAPLQSKGVPILCNDLPAIPVDVSQLLNE